MTIFTCTFIPFLSNAQFLLKGKVCVWLMMGCIIESIFSTRFHNCAFTFHFSKEMGHDPSDTCYQASAIRKNSSLCWATYF